jgi:hypothetical protein
VERTPWNQAEVVLTESEVILSKDVRDQPSYPRGSLEDYLEQFNTQNAFRQPISVRSIATMFGNHIAMKMEGIVKKRPWDKEKNTWGKRQTVIDVKYWQRRFDLEEERRRSMADEPTRGPLSKFVDKEPDAESECTCDVCSLDDEKLLLEYIRLFKEDWVDQQSLELFLTSGLYPPTLRTQQKIEDMKWGATMIQNAWRTYNNEKNTKKAIIEAQKERERLAQQRKDDAELAKRCEKETKEREERLAKEKKDMSERFSFLRKPKRTEDGKCSCTAFKFTGICGCDFDDSARRDGDKCDGFN